jgi:tetratricopeptide (TPR) repeat protein
MKKAHLMILLAFAFVLAVASLFYLQRTGPKESLREAVVLESGIALFRENKYQESFEVLRGIAPGNPQEWRAKYYQGSALIMLKNHESAVVYLEQAFALNDRETRIMHALGVAYYKLGNLKMSKGYFAALLEVDPNNEEAKGLMDIMTSLERTQPGEAQEDAPGDSAGVDDH